MLALATSVGAGYDAYCSHLTARYLTYLQREDVLIFHHGQGYIARPVDRAASTSGCRGASTMASSQWPP